MNSILIRPASMWPVYLPKTNDFQSRWLNLAKAEQIIVISEDPLVVEIIFDTASYYENCPAIVFEGIQAEAIVKALEEFPNGKVTT